MKARVFNYFDSGEPLAIMDATLVTTKRTEAVVALAVQTLDKNDFSFIAVFGLEQTVNCF